MSTTETSAETDMGVTAQEAEAAQSTEAALAELKALTGGRRKRGMGSRGRKGGTFLADISVPVALLAATQYMKGRRRYGKTSNRRRRRRTRKNVRRRSGNRRR